MNKESMNNSNSVDIQDVQVVVLMGGMGTRLGLQNCPKALADVNGSPFFSYELKLLLRFGFHDFLFLVGNGAEQIEDYFGDGQKWNVAIRYLRDGEELLGTGGAIKRALPYLKDDFLLIYGDSFMDVDYREICGLYFTEVKGRLSALMTVFHNDGMYDKSNAKMEEDSRVNYNKFNPTDDMEYIDYGISVFSKKVFETDEYGDVFDLANIVQDLSGEKKVYGLQVYNRFYEIGTPDSLEEFREYAYKRFIDSNKAIFWDRDGVINEIVYNEDIEQMDSPLKVAEIKFCEDVFYVMLMIQKLGYKQFIVTNQPAAAKGKVSLERIYEINNRIVCDLKKLGIRIDGVGLCPHHPAGSKSCRYSFLVQKCNCRKPSHGLITDILSVYNINTAESYMIGDSYTDIVAGKNAGLKTVLLGVLKCDACKRLDDCAPDYIIKNLKEIGGLLSE